MTEEQRAQLDAARRRWSTNGSLLRDKTIEQLQEFLGPPGGMAYAASEELALRHELGIDVPVDKGEALRMLELSALTSGSALNRLITEYRSGGALVAHDPERLEHWLRVGVQRDAHSARAELAELLRAGRHASEIPADTLREIIDLYSRNGAFYEIASMHCAPDEREFRTAEEVATAKTWYCNGYHAGPVRVDARCKPVLQQWGLLPEDAPEVGPSPLFPEPKRWNFTVWEFIAMPVSLVLWGIVGMGLLAVAAWIASYTLPVVMVIAALGGVLYLFRK